jgi:hypothetical protein
MSMLQQVKHDRTHALGGALGIHDVGFLISWLNDTRDREAKARVCKLLKLCMDARAAARGMSHEDFVRRTARFRKLKRLEGQATGVLVRYPAIRWIMCIPDGRAIAPWVPQHARQDLEFESVVLLMDLFEQDALSKVQVCECGTYFNARSILSRFCSKTCRERFWENSEARKEQKRKKAREYYWHHKNKQSK